MPKLAYVEHNFQKASLAQIDLAESICNEYAAQGLTLTLRQIYYQFVARGHIPNSQREYKKLGDLLNNARLSGRIDWFHMEDRTRFLRKSQSWSSPLEIIEAVGSSYRRDPWKEQPKHVEVWIEKDALVGVIEGTCQEERVGYFACRGYTSQSELWQAAQRHMRIARDKIKRGLSENEDEQTIILHLGDHDPSGMDMSRDIEDRLQLFHSAHGFTPPTMLRLALNMEQIERYSPPPNPAKSSDARYHAYEQEFGTESWELDALEPSLIGTLIREAIEKYREPDAWSASLAREETERQQLADLVERWDDVTELLSQLASGYNVSYYDPNEDYSDLIDPAGLDS